MSSISTLELFQSQHGGNLKEMGWNTCGFSERVDAIMNCTVLKVNEPVVVVERLQRSLCNVAVPGKPQNLHTEKISSTKILVKWDAPQTTSAIDSYVLYCTLHTQQSISIVPPQTIYILEDITPNAKYNFSVFAKPKCGKGPRSDPKKDRTQAHRKLNDVLVDTFVIVFS